jgi:hypothetical protein
MRRARGRGTGRGGFGVCENDDVIRHGGQSGDGVNEGCETSRSAEGHGESKPERQVTGSECDHEEILVPHDERAYTQPSESEQQTDTGDLCEDQLHVG